MGNNRPKLTQEYLKECLTYDPNTGIFTWNTRPLSHFKNSHGCNIWNARWGGGITTYINSGGYPSLMLGKRLYLCHRLAFLYVEGYMPENQVDHIDRDRSNNKWSNLREVSNQCNQQNCNIQINNTSGVCGVTWFKRNKKWRAQMHEGERNIYLGYFENFADAVMARYQEEVNNPKRTCTEESTAYKYLKEHNLI